MASCLDTVLSQLAGRTLEDRDVIAKADRALPAYLAGALQRSDFQALGSSGGYVDDAASGLRFGC